MLLNELIVDLRDESALWDALTAEDDEEADAVRTVFAWSYRALPEAAARLFRLLGIHPGPEFGVQAAAALAGITDGQARHLLDVLVGAHMLEQHAPGRHQFHDLLRAYANDQTVRQETPEDRLAALGRVLSWYLRTANAAATVIAPLNRHVAIDAPEGAIIPSLFAEPGEAFRWYEGERENLVAATRAAFDADLHVLAWQLPAVMRNIYARQNAFENWITTGHIGLDSALRVGDRSGEAELLESLGMAYLQSGRLADAEACHRGALAIREQIGDRLGAAMSINALGLLAWRHHGLAEARSRFAEALALYQELGERRWVALSLSNLGMTYNDLDRPADALDVLRDALTICRELGDDLYQGNALHFLAIAQRELGHVSEALASIQDALVIAHDDNSLAAEAFWLLELARIQRALGQPAEALTSCQRSAAIQRRLGDRSREAMALDSTGDAYRELGLPDEAAKFHRIAAATHRELGDRWHLATALVNLGTALHETGSSEQAQPHWEEAAMILAEFDDPRATRMRDRVTEVLGGT